eukprot:1076268-Pyramimonas_sp.AAC.1
MEGGLILADMETIWGPFPAATFQGCHGFTAAGQKIQVPGPNSPRGCSARICWGISIWGRCWKG